MLLRTHTFVRVAIGSLRSRTHERLVELTRNEVGATAAEYALLVALIAVAIVVGANLLGTAVDARLTDTASCIDTAPAVCP
jgi:pilus assembly protein Flp/PilA